MSKYIIIFVPRNENDQLFTNPLALGNMHTSCCGGILLYGFRLSSCYGSQGVVSVIPVVMGLFL